MPDLWRPCATLAALQLGCTVRRSIRHWFERQDVLEVVTPHLSAAAATDPHVHTCTLAGQARLTGAGGVPRYLHTSPEFPMKRLLAAYGTDIYQLCNVFRAGETGRHHNLEFTLLEWYRIGFDHRQLMKDVESLLASVFAALGRPWLPATILPYASALFTATALRLEHIDSAIIEAYFRDNDRSWPASIGSDTDAALDLLMDEFVLPTLPADRATFITDYPASQAALARLAPDGRSAERFELYFGTLELANGFHELSDAAEQRRRFENDLHVRRAQALPAVPIDEHLLQALAEGLPDCAGVALGIERLLMVLSGADHIDDVLAFGHARA